jgi:hypothetical protein
MGMPHVSGGEKQSQAPQLVVRYCDGSEQALGAFSYNPQLYEWFALLSSWLAHTRVLALDWRRLAHYYQSDSLPVTAILFDPPYATPAERAKVYHHDSFAVGQAVRDYCVTAQMGDARHKGTPLGEVVRICYCGYESEMGELRAAGWRIEEWTRPGGSQRGVVHAERLAFSPACVGFDKGLF